MPTVPIAIISFNRPDLLAILLDSLKDQKHFDLSNQRIALFQDGWMDQENGNSLIDPSISDECIRIFKERFLNGYVFAGATNLGIAFNIDRAERFIFEELGAEAGIFFEDDLELGHFYLSTLQKFIEQALEDERIGYVSAFGNPRLTNANMDAKFVQTHPTSSSLGFRAYEATLVKMPTLR